jgi:hypothetical protein
MKKARSTLFVALAILAIAALAMPVYATKPTEVTGQWKATSTPPGG